MNEYPQPGVHPDPDSLNAFIEGVLPEHERLACLTHLAECPVCREVVYLVQESLAQESLAQVPSTPESVALPAPAEKASFWKWWLRPLPALGAVAVAAALVLSVWLTQRNQGASKRPELIAIAPQARESVPELEGTKQSQPNYILDQQARTPAVPKIKPAAPVAMAAARKTEATRPDAASASIGTGALDSAAVTAEPQPALSAADASAAAAAPPQVRAAPSELPRPAAAPGGAARGTFRSSAFSAAPSGITGTIVDPAGAAIAGATVKVNPQAGPAGRNLRSDQSGQFNVTGLEPGRYEVQVAAPGFQQMTKLVDVQPEEMARADSTLSVGTVSESISVQANAAQVMTESASVAASKSVVRPLPSKLPAETSAAQGKRMLAADTAGALFLSQDSGKKWKAVKPVWAGKVVSLVALSTTTSTTGAVFQLTTGDGSLWLSRDGSHWYAEPSQR